MPFEKGGRADKLGNRYEIKCTIYELLKVLDEKNYSVEIEALGINEKGTDILVTDMEGKKEHQQCKARNASKEYWDISDFKAKGICKSWYIQLNRDSRRCVAVVSPMACTFLVDLHGRALNTSGKAEEFFYVQIMESRKEFRKFYQDFCEQMNLNISEQNAEMENEILKSIDYLRRIHYKRMSEYEIQELIDQSIHFLFRNEINIVYNAMVSLVCMKDILGKEISQPFLMEYLKKQGIEMRLRDGDDRIFPRLNEINQEYRDAFRPLQGGLIYRKEFDECINMIKTEKSFIISGRAGYGKSGCTEFIINYCEAEHIPYIAIKLDRRIPKKNCESWGKELGLSGSIVHAIHCVSQYKKAVIILDQLDALRWTQADSSEALLVCMELIRQVRYFNRERKSKIIVVFVCRKYDLENDNNINSLFDKKNDVSEDSWSIVRVQNFDEETVKKIIGKKYDQLTSKLKKILMIPSNLYIWQHLDQGESYGDCLTASHLVEKWYQQICKKGTFVGVSEKTVIETIGCIVDKLDRAGRLFVSRQALAIETRGLEYLISCGIIFVQKNKVGFVHQSILDYFMSKRMTEKYVSDYQGIEEIVGEKSRQTPGRRYQVQMFLQNMLDYDTADFITAGEKLLISENVRYYVKFTFYEVLGQISEPDDNIIQFIVDECENEIYGDYLLDNVIFARKQYVSVLRKAGILDKWFAEPAKREKVFKLLRSISIDLEAADIEFIRKRAFMNEEDDKKFISCFGHDITREKDEMFELRMMFYKHYPAFAEDFYIDLSLMMNKCEIRTVRLIAFWLSNKIQSKGEQLYRHAEELISSDNSFAVSDGESVLDLLLPYVPRDNSEKIKNSEWSGLYKQTEGIERCCVELVKKANMAVISKSPEVFWERYKPYMGKGYYIFNEIILTGMQYLNDGFSNRVISYICSDIDKNAIDYTSGAKNSLELVKEIIRIHARKCDLEIFCGLENKICQYISPDAAKRYKRRIDRNRNHENEPMYWSFWGDLQWELLPCLPKERLNKETENLLQVLNRRFAKIQSRRYYNNFQAGGVASAISGKKIGIKQWLQIMTNNKLLTRRNSKWVEEKRCYVESSYSIFVEDFEKAVKQEPEAMIRLVLEHKDEILPDFIENLFSGVAFSENLDRVSVKVLEQMFLEFPCDMESPRAFYFCSIVEKLGDIKWSDVVIKQLKEIALNHKGLELRKMRSSKEAVLESCQELCQDALNCERGYAVSAIKQLVLENEQLLEQFRDIIDKLIKDENAVMRYASLDLLWVSYNIDRTWTEERMIYLFESDIRMSWYHDSTSIFFKLYPVYKKQVLKIVEHCFESADNDLIELGSGAVCEFYIIYGEFETVLFDSSAKSETQVKAILDMAVVYLGVNDYRELAKSIILKYKNCYRGAEFLLSKIFYNKLVDFERDKEFLLEFMKSKVSRRTTCAFTRYLEKSACSVVDYADIIIALCENVLQMKQEEIEKQWGIADDISKLIMAIYDETANSMSKANRQIAERCLDLWDIMFEKQLGCVREISYKLMER